jgi:muramoyltetrapeptide carboxypeptidase
MVALKVSKVVVGSMTKMKDNDIPWGKNALEISERYKII